MMTFKKYLEIRTEAAPLAVFRILFGFLMLASIVRFWYNGWIDKLYIQPKLFFSYYGFEWIKPIGDYTYILFVLCAIASICIIVGYKYRMAIVIFFLCFTYIELMDKTTYLNHYYFVSILSFLLIFLPMNTYYSIDAKLNPHLSFQKIPKWAIDSLKLLLCIVYFYAGLAKLNSDWLIDALPLKIWLPAKYDLPLLGKILGETWAHYAFSWSGVVYDLTIPFFLLYKRTRPYAYIVVIVFHVLTRVLFPIGMFPFIMIMATIIFFEAAFHHKLLRYLSNLLKISKTYFDNGESMVLTQIHRNFVPRLFVVFFVMQLLMPFRYLLYPGELFWTEEGYRFSWRVMLMEKAGYAQFKILNSNTGKWFYVDNTDFLTPFQEKQMAFQPDFILEYAHYLENHFKAQGHKNIEIYVESYVTLNGRRSTALVDPKIDLTKEKESFKHKHWLIPFTDDIKGI